MTVELSHMRADRGCRNAKAVDVKLSKEEVDDIRKTIESVGGTKGERYPPAMMSKCFGDSPELKA